ncbi:D-alanyl-D-alanine carboxypeptidase/D-alanyl-D-alanine-endopeptidase [Lutimonas zeaxanthinifaciens]|uniref:D-alanyl-D-alanine carboxypeptidase/D-alanyl-D-alanine-endopeptidase n=1 Tax=Lutimonas zeaxanthinifaciens TaxID=3060215 RepID=UPI00265D32CD|nr:D-alanyl-D-alanine carboxypeptidase [Lutimonas sp. YSD2104]WKK67237.1 D-alanyl-D-alanine carboxypeptidase [Lutimonas sp. YSD2104]
MKIAKYILVLTLFICSGCSVSRQLEKELDSTAGDNSFFQGVVVAEAESGKIIISHNGQKYFTPASNVKIFTLYAALRSIKDTIPTFDYAVKEDSLILRGTGHPLFLVDSLNEKALRFLRDSQERLYLSDIAIEDRIFGPGWSWEDFSYSYMPERTIFPMYSNLLSVAKKGDDISVVPELLNEKLNFSSQRRIYREPESNDFYFPDHGDYERLIPFKTSIQLSADILGGVLNKKVILVPEDIKRQYKSFKEIPNDTLYSRMMYESDNFIAEQLLLRVGYETSGKYNSKTAIDYVLKNFLSDIDQRPRWVDGSGLSRYNLFSPESIVNVLQKLYLEAPSEKLSIYFPEGGRSGTLKNDFQGQSYIRAKSGTLSNNYSLSGYLTTKRGTVLVFSFMNNHYQGSAVSRKKRMSAFFKELYEKY